MIRCFATMAYNLTNWCSPDAASDDETEVAAQS